MLFVVFYKSPTDPTPKPHSHQRTYRSVRTAMDNSVRRYGVGPFTIVRVRHNEAGEEVFAEVTTAPGQHQKTFYIVEVGQFAVDQINLP